MGLVIAYLLMCMPPTSQKTGSWRAQTATPSNKHDMKASTTRDGIWWSWADTKPWVDIDECYRVDPNAAKETADAFGAYTRTRFARFVRKERILRRKTEA